MTNDVQHNDSLQKTHDNQPDENRCQETAGACNERAEKKCFHADIRFGMM